MTPQQARAALDDFIENRLADFGRVEDAMWTGEPVVYHSRLSAALNLKLLDPRDALAAAVEAYQRKRAPLAAVEGFVRQLLGWREYVRGVYWLFMPGYATRNELAADMPLPEFYWTGETDLNCLRHVVGQTMELGYAHHIQRLMVTGLFALLLGVRPRAVHEWYLAVYVDAVEWVELPNVLGMSQYADGGVMASKPYVATGKYIQRMSILRRHGRLDGVVNCVGSILLKPAHLTSDDDWNATLATNLTTSFNLLRAAVRVMMTGGGGSIVLISTVAAQRGLFNHEAIAAAKAGVEGLTRSAASTYARYKIRVNGVAPGLVRTPLSRAITGSEAALKASLALHPLGRVGEPGDIASAICWLLSPEQSWITGQVLHVDGGMSTVQPR